jgi:hypothetical protein
MNAVEVLEESTIPRMAKKTGSQKIEGFAKKTR